MKDDVISRQAVLKLLSAMPPEEAMTKTLLIQSVKQMDDAQPERKTGEWREHIFDGIMGRRPRALMCTNCNVISIYASNFCPNCGADMREDNHETD